jgi:hypothetical protein
MHNPYATAFRWAVVVGIIQDLIVGIPGIFAPNAVLSIVAEPVPNPVWPAFAANLLVLLAMFYIPAALDPFRYRIVAIMTVLARAAGVVFFLVIWRGAAPAWFGYLDLMFGTVQGILLVLAYRQARQTQASVSLEAAT